jgi:hypothetical protein
VKNSTTTAILAATGTRGTEATLTVATDFDSLAAQIGGTVKGSLLDKGTGTAVFFDSEKQTATLLDPYALQGFLVLCGIDKDGNPISLATVKQVNKFSRVFKATRNTTAEPRKEVK